MENVQTYLGEIQSRDNDNSVGMLKTYQVMQKCYVYQYIDVHDDNTVVKVLC
jgi:hypothetical protein